VSAPTARLIAAGHDVAAIYGAHGHVVLRRARQLLGNETEAQDVLQEIFMSLMTSPGQFDGRSAATTFLYSATTHRCLNRLRDRATRARLLRGRPRAEAGEARSDAIAEVRDLLARLPDELAQAAVYSYVDEMTHEEIAEQMGCSRRHVGDLLARASELARKRVGE
jgi:RNA polymerase sigma factor (sigma-70 family)